MTLQQFLREKRTFETPEAAGAGGGAGGAAGGGGHGTPPATPPAGDPGAAGNPPAAAPGTEGAGDQYAWFGDGLDDDAKQYLENKKFSSPADLYKSLRGAEKLIRGDHIAGPPSDPEKHGEWMKESGLAGRLGIPEEASGYEIRPPEFSEDVAGMVNYSDERHGRILDTAHKLNMTPAQVSGMLELYKSEMSDDAQAYVTEAAADEQQMQTELKREWGEGYDTRLAAALEVAQEVGLDANGIEALRVGRVAGSTVLTKILHELAEVRGNDTLKGGGTGGVAPPTQEQAQAALNEFMSKNGAILTNREHPEHAQKMSEFEGLKRRAGRGSAGRG